MQPLGGRSFLTSMPDYLPVKLYFANIKGLDGKVREVVHENLKSGNNSIIEFRIQCSKKGLDKLLK